MPLCRLNKLLVAYAWLCGGIACAQVQARWQGVFTNGGIKDMVCDGAGNVIAAARILDPSGVLEEKLQVAKFSHDGTRVWTREFLGLDGSSLEPGFLDVDPSGNVFILGQTNFSNIWLLHKLDPAGQLVWRIGGSNSLPVLPRIACDRTAGGAGTTIMAGIDLQSTGKTRHWIVRYDASGNRVWKTNIFILRIDPYRAGGLAFDYSGNIVLVGRGYYETVLKLSAAGSLLWALTEPSHIENFTVASDDGVYTSGYGGVRKINASGAVAWWITNKAAVLAPDSTGGVLLSEQHSSSYWTLTKLDANGNIGWRSPLPEPAFGHVTDSSGNHLVALVRPGYWGEPIRLASYTPEGDARWSVTLTNHQLSTATWPILAHGFNDQVLISGQAPSGGAVLAVQPIALPDLPRVTRHPTNRTVAVYATVELVVEAESVSPLHFEWYHEGERIGVTNATLTLSNITLEASGDYYAEVSNATGVTYSRIATLRVLEPPYILPDRDVALALNASVELQPLVTGPEPLNYQWQHDGIALPIATNQTLELRNVTLDAAGEYSLRVRNEVGAVTSVVAHVLVNPGVFENWRSSVYISNLCCDSVCVQVANNDGSVYLAYGRGLLLYDADGHILWQTNHPCSDIVRDGAGGIIAGSRGNLARFTRNGTNQWLRDTRVFALATRGDTIVGVDDVIRIFDLLGTPLDTIYPDCNDCYWYSLHDVLPASDAGFFCAGTLDSPALGYSRFGVARFDAAGQLFWSSPLDIPLSSFYGQVDWAHTPNDGLVATGLLWLDDGPPSHLTIRLNGDGQEIWRRTRHNLPYPATPMTPRVTVDPADNTVTATAGNIARYDMSGEELWRLPSGHPRFGVQNPLAMASDLSGAIYLFGNGSIYGDRLVLEKLWSDGSTAWVTSLGERWQEPDRADIQVDSSGAVYVSAVDWLTVRTFKVSQTPSTDAPRIIAQPDPGYRAVTPGTEVTLQAEVAGTGTLHYQWFQSSSGFPVSAIPGAVTSTLVISNLEGGPWEYFLEARNAFGYAWSKRVTVEVGLPPYFDVIDGTTWVTGFTRVNEGGSVLLKAGPSLDPAEPDVAYRWFLNGIAVPNATNGLLRVANAQPLQAGDYMLVASNRFGSSSAAIHLLVESRVHTFEIWEPGPENDLADSASLHVGATSQNQVYLIGSEGTFEPYALTWFLAKYSTSGETLWRISRLPLEGGIAEPLAMVVDGEDNIIVGSVETSFGNVQLVLVKYDRFGDLLWEVPYPPMTDVSTLAVNDSNEIFAAGNYWGIPFTTSLFVGKFSSAGEFLWEILRADQPDGDQPAILNSGDGGVFLSCADGLTRFDGAGEPLWHMGTNFQGIASAEADHLYVGGRSTAKYSYDGVEIWSQANPTTAIYGNTSGLVRVRGNVTQKLAPQGHVLWRSSVVQDEIATGTQGETYACGILGDQLFTRRISPGGAEVWLARNALGHNWREARTAMTLCQNGDVISAYLLFRPAGGTEYVLQRHHQTLTSPVPRLGLAPVSLSVREGDFVCLTAAVDIVDVPLQWFHVAGPLPGQTNTTLCLEANVFTESFFHYMIRTTNGFFTSPEASVELQRPFLRPLTIMSNGQLLVRLLSSHGPGPVALEMSADLVQWQVLTNWPYAYGEPYEVVIPLQRSAPQFFRLSEPRAP